MARSEINARSSQRKEAPVIADCGLRIADFRWARLAREALALRVWWILALLLFSAFSSFAQTPIRFATVDIFVDSISKSLAAYQLEFKTVGGNVKIVGIEGGEHAAFKEPAFYDPKAMQQERVILAAFSTARNLPKGKTRIATIHVQITNEAKPEWAVKLVTAADASGKKIAAVVEVKERNKP